MEAPATPSLSWLTTHRAERAEARRRRPYSQRVSKLARYRSEIVALASLEQRLDPLRFARVHRSAIVRLDRVREMRTVSGGESVLVLRDGTRVPVSRRRREQVASLIRRTVR